MIVIPDDYAAVFQSVEHQFVRAEPVFGSYVLYDVRVDVIVSQYLV